MYIYGLRICMGYGPKSILEVLHEEVFYIRYYVDITGFKIHLTILLLVFCSTHCYIILGPNF